MAIQVLLPDHAGSTNRGCEAIVRSFVASLREHCPGLETTVATKDPKREAVRLGDIDGMQCVPMRWRRWSRRRFAVSLLSRISKQTAARVGAGHFSRWIDSSDAVFSVGGDVIGMFYGGPWRWLEVLALAKRRGKVAAIQGASIGPFQDPHIYAYARRRLSALDLICARESVTYEYLTDMGLTNVKLVADPAFLLPTAEVGDGVCPPEGLRIGFGLSAQMGKFTGVGPDLSLEIAARHVRELLERSDATVCLIPHVFYPEDGIQDDFWMCERVAERVAAGNRIWKLPHRDFNAMQLKRIIGMCGVFAGARTHSTIASYSQYVPTLTFTYSVKSKGMARDVYGHQDYVLRWCEEDIEVNVERILDVMTRRDAIRSEMQEGVTGLVSRARLNGRYCAAVLEQQAVGGSPV